MAKSKKKQKRYLIQTPVKRASGWQSWYIVADSPEEALELHKAGYSEYMDEEVEVTALGDPVVVGEEEIE